jgi:hypothetical protein
LSTRQPGGNIIHAEVVLPRRHQGRLTECRRQNAVSYWYDTGHQRLMASRERQTAQPTKESHVQNAARNCGNALYISYTMNNKTQQTFTILVSNYAAATLSSLN